MYCTPNEMRTAKKVHQCTNCGEEIVIGEKYVRWMSVDDGKGFANKMHKECIASLIDENGAGFWEYSPFGGERPNVKFNDGVQGNEHANLEMGTRSY